LERAIASMPSPSGGHAEERFAPSSARRLVEVADLRPDEAVMRSYQKECLDAGQQCCFTFGKTLGTPASPLRRCRCTRIVLLLHPDRHSPINFIMVVTKTHKTTQLVSTLFNSKAHRDCQLIAHLPTCWCSALFSTLRKPPVAASSPSPSATAKKMSALCITLVPDAHGLAFCYSPRAQLLRKSITDFALAMAHLPPS
jgi:hypothetical protein